MAYKQNFSHIQIKPPYTRLYQVMPINIGYFIISQVPSNLY